MAADEAWFYFEAMPQVPWGSHRDYDTLAVEDGSSPRSSSPYGFLKENGLLTSKLCYTQCRWGEVGFSEPGALPDHPNR